MDRGDSYRHPQPEPGVLTERALAQAPQKSRRTLRPYAYGSLALAATLPVAFLLLPKMKHATTKKCGTNARKVNALTSRKVNARSARKATMPTQEKYNADLQAKDQCRRKKSQCRRKKSLNADARKVNADARKVNADCQEKSHAGRKRKSPCFRRKKSQCLTQEKSMPTQEKLQCRLRKKSQCRLARKVQCRRKKNFLLSLRLLLWRLSRACCAGRMKSLFSRQARGGVAARGLNLSSLSSSSNARGTQLALVAGKRLSEVEGTPLTPLPNAPTYENPQLKTALTRWPDGTVVGTLALGTPSRGGLIPKAYLVYVAAFDAKGTLVSTAQTELPGAGGMASVKLGLAPTAQHYQLALFAKPAPPKE